MNYKGFEIPDYVPIEERHDMPYGRCYGHIDVLTIEYYTISVNKVNLPNREHPFSYGINTEGSCVRDSHGKTYESNIKHAIDSTLELIEQDNRWFS